MEIINKEYVLSNKEKIHSEILKGKIFIYPTDTIYGLGTNATINSSVMKLRKIKMRNNKPFSVIAPSKDWIKENCIINKDIEEWIKKLPGPYTLILKLKNKNAVNKEVNLGQETIGIRIPNNWFTKIIEELNIPFVTTSVNISGNPYLKDIRDIEKQIEDKIDYIIEDGILDGKPSTIVNLTKDKEEIIQR